MKKVLISLNFIKIFQNFGLFTKEPGDKRNSKRTSKPLTIRPIVNERKEVNVYLKFIKI